MSFIRKTISADHRNFTTQKKLSEQLGGAKIYLKREDMNHTGSHKLNNVLGQALLAKRLGKKRIIAETGAGQHGVATATACALFDMECIVYMGEEDTRRQALNVFRMKLLGAKVVAVTSGTRTLKDAVDVALADLIANYKDTYYMLGSAVGPDPVSRNGKVLSELHRKRTKQQCLEAEGRLPDYVMACVGGGSNAIGMFAPFFYDESVKMIGIEPAGRGLDTQDHAATLTLGTPGIIHGFKCKVIQDENGEPLPVYSVSAGSITPVWDPSTAIIRQSAERNMTARPTTRLLTHFLHFQELRELSRQSKALTLLRER